MKLFRADRLMNSILVAALAVNLVGSTAKATGAVNFWGDYFGVNGVAHNDPNQPVSSGRSYFTTATEEVPGGFKLIVDIWSGEKNVPVALWLQVAINDGKGKIQAIPIMQLNDYVKDNPDNYHSRREFVLTYQQINDAIKANVSSSAQHLQVGPGSALFLYGHWKAYSHYGHSWGGFERGGIFFAPESKNSTSTHAIAAPARQPTELDIAYPISNIMTMQYNDQINGQSSGLKKGGQIRSRLESEGKFQIPLDDAPAMRAKLFALANDPAQAAQILGADWTVSAEMRYMKKDAQGQLILDQHGHPTPDPMVDTYYDSKDSKGASNDIALRYRWTEGNATGAWNFKPGLTHMSPEGIVNRIEYGIDTTDDKPETIKKFANSMDPLNPLKLIRELVPGATPSDFLLPSVKVTDVRHKFKLKHKNGLVIELSLDDVLAESLRGPQKTRFVQLEADIDHLSTASNNVASTASGGLSGDISSFKGFLQNLDSNAFLDGRAVIHSSKDLDPKSPVLKAHANDFAEAEIAIKALRSHVAGKNWLPAPQKASLAAVLLGHVDKAHASKSVRTLIDSVKAQKAGGKDPGRIFEDHGAAFCKRIFH